MMERVFDQIDNLKKSVRVWGGGQVNAEPQLYMSQADRYAEERAKRKAAKQRRKALNPIMLSGIGQHHTRNGANSNGNMW